MNKILFPDLVFYSSLSDIGKLLILMLTFYMQE